MSDPHFVIRHATRSGQGARGYQEDCAGQVTHGHLSCFVVADGAGGHGGGHIASNLAVRAILDLFAKLPSADYGLMQQLILYSHHVVKAGQQKFSQYPDMRSTVVAAIFDSVSGKLILGNVGDSRGYVFTANGHQRTKDHTVLQQMRDSGLPIPEGEADSRATNALLSSLGSTDEPQVHLMEAEVALESGDCVMLCTDGWWDTLPPRELRNAIRDKDQLDLLLQTLEGQLMLQAKHDQDNFTATLIHFERVIAESTPAREIDPDATIVMSRYVDPAAENAGEARP
jgi:PPM family protein phosphatase